MSSTGRYERQGVGPVCAERLMVALPLQVTMSWPAVPLRKPEDIEYRFTFVDDGDDPYDAPDSHRYIQDGDNRQYATHTHLDECSSMAVDLSPLLQPGLCVTSTMASL